MFCKNCGKEMRPEDTVCEFCKCDNSPSAISAGRTNKIPFIMQVIYCIIGQAAGICSLISGIYGINFYDYDYLRKITFGADFYTEIYAATKAAAGNIIVLGGVMEKFANAFLICTGIFMIAFFGLSLFKAIAKRQENK
ncbi:MAG: hypothetical protein PUA81_05445 [Oscillospiraceae bacterium]|nr:hypothetical protein [Oscillospiraceae bacterium]